MDSSTDDSPYTTMPSAAILSPGFATTISPITMLSASTIISSSSSCLPFLSFLVLITTAVLGLRASRFFIDSEVVLSTLPSRYSPIVKIVKTEADASKNIVAVAESANNENKL